MRQTQLASLDPASFPRQPATSMKPQSWANLRYLLRVQWLPPQPGQQALTVRFHAAGRVSGGLGPPSKQKGRDISIEPSRTWDGHSIWPPTLRVALLCAFSSWSSFPRVQSKMNLGRLTGGQAQAAGMGCPHRSVHSPTQRPPRTDSPLRTRPDPLPKSLLPQVTTQASPKLSGSYTLLACSAASPGSTLTHLKMGQSPARPLRDRSSRQPRRW